MADNIQVRQNPDKTNAKSKAATIAAFIVGAIVVMMTNYGIEMEDSMVEMMVNIVAILLIPAATKVFGYLKAMDIDDIEVSDDGQNWKKVAGVVANELDDIDHKTGKRKKLKKIGRLIGQAIKFLT